MSKQLAGLLKHGVPFLLICAALYAARGHGYLLFHSLAEIFSAVVALGVFLVAWNARRYATDRYLLWLGGASLFVGGIDLLHALAYKDMGVFARAQGDADLATQLWVAARYVQAGAFLIAPVFIRRRLNLPTAVGICGIATVALLGLIFGRYFPACFVQGVGLTPFKRISEYAICAALVGAMLLLLRERKHFDRYVLGLLLGSLAVMVASELCFTIYSTPESAANFLGHYLKILAFFLIYKAVVETGLARPYALLFRDLAQSEAAMRESEERYRTLVELSPRAILVDDGENYLYANRSAVRLFGATGPEQLVGQSVLDHVHPEDRPKVQQRMEKLRMPGTHLGAIEARILRLDSAAVPVETIAAHISYRNQPAVQVVMEDITQRKAAEQALRDAKAEAEGANRAKDHFLATLSHELRTPLTPVLAAASVLKDDAALPEPVRSDLALIHRNVELQARLIDDLLDLTRIARGKLELSLRTVDVHDLLRHAVEICRSDAYAKEQKVVLELHATRFHVRGDASRLQQVFWNLLKNAVKFTPPGGRVVIRTRDGGPPGAAAAGCLIAEVQDTGIGIEPEDLARVFDAFEQGSRRITRQFGGLGLGLAICKAVVEMHGGKVCAASAGRDRGATFTVRLATVEAPVAEAERSPLAPAVPATARALRILVVEDHADTAYLMSRLLEKLNHAVQTAGSVRDAMTVARGNSFDLVISDLGLPDGSGLDLMRQLKEQYGLRGICLSGYGMDKDIAASRDAGFVQHLIKPIDFQNLKHAIQEAARAD